MGFFDWLKRQNLNSEEQADVEQLQSVVQRAKPKLFFHIATPEKVSFSVMPDKRKAGVPAQPERPKGVCYPDGAGWRLIWQRRDGSTSESYSAQRPDGFRMADDKASAELVAGKPATGKPISAADAAVVKAAMLKAKQAGKQAPDNVPTGDDDNATLNATAEERPFFLDQPTRIPHSKGQRISRPFPRLR